jgi:hypothetical protein
MLLVLYAKIVDDKDLGVLMTGIFIGGVVESITEADDLARRCVQSVQGGIAITKITAILNDDFRQTVKNMEITFGRMADRMYESEKTVSKTRFD